MRAAGFALAMALLAFAPRALGSEARDAYERGTAAFKAHDYATAAREFARADELSPSPVALRAALDATIKADDPVLGAELIERAARAPATGDLAKSLELAKAKLAHRAGKIHVSCTDCTAALDGRPLDPAHAAWASLGKHLVTVAAHGLTRDDNVDVAADATVEVAAPAAPEPATVDVAPPITPAPPPSSTPPPTVAPPPPPTTTPPVVASGSHKVGPWLFVTGAIVTAGLAGVAIWSGADTAGKHSDFVGAGCQGTTPQATCDSISSAGSSAQFRTNVLLAGTAVAGVATILIGALFTRWSGPAVTAFVSPAGGAISMHASF